MSPQRHARALLEDGKAEVVVEIPRGSRNKYEQDQDGVIWFDRRLGGPAGFPGDYGYVVGARGEDGDALDALVLMDEATMPGVHMICRVIGAFVLSIDSAEETKLLCVPDGDRHQRHLRDLADLPDDFVAELDAFFRAYRMLEPGEIGVTRHQGRDETMAALGRAVAAPED
jgi:inorganic pyrophosphatase